MDRSTFASRLAEASRAAVEFARRFVDEPLLDTVRFCVELNASYDGNPLHPDENIYPEDLQAHPVSQRARIELDTLVSLLWRDGAVPEWVNLSVESADAEATIVGVMACGRFTKNEALLYHEREGRPPFHVLGPSLPPDSWRGESDRFSLWWTAHARDHGALARAAAHADKVRILVASGVWCDDTALALVGSFPRLATLRLEHTAVVGRGLAHLLGRSPLEHIAVTGVSAQPVDLSAMGKLSTLRSVHVDGDPTDVLGADALVALSALTDLTLNLRALASLAFVRGLVSIERLSVNGSGVASLEPLRESSRLQSLDLDRMGITDDQLPHLVRLPRLRTLSLNGTAVTDRGVCVLATISSLRRLWLVNTLVSDAALDAIAAARQLDKLDVRGTRVTLAGVTRLASARPDLRIVADGWKQPSRRMRPESGS